MLERRFGQWIPPFPAVPPDSAGLVDVVFNVTRGRPLLPAGPDAQERLPAFLRWEPELQRQVPLNVVRFRFRPQDYEPRPIAIESTGERLELVKIVLRRGNHQPVAVFAPVPDCPNRGLQPVDINDAIGASIGAREYLVALSDAISALPAADPRKAPLRLFYQFDLHTNPLIWENLELQGEVLDAWLDPDLVADRDKAEVAIQSTTERLAGRLIERVKSHPDVPVFPAYDPDDEPEAHAETRLLSELQLQLYDGHTLTELGRAFEMFANGKLRMQLDNLAIAAQPSSGFYFLFGEFALLAMDNRISKRAWRNRARFLLRTQPVFAQTYGDPNVAGRDRDLDSYAAQNFCGSKVGDPVLADLTSEYQSLSETRLAAKASENAEAYLGGL